MRLRVSDLHGLLRANLRPELLDLLEVAAYVSAADQSAPRSDRAHDLGDGWRRRFHFRVPVRRPDLWGDPAVKAALADALGYVTDDEYRFEFVALRNPAKGPTYIEFGELPFQGQIDEVALFSGGLDSLAGAIDAAANRRRRALLVNHRSHEKWTPVFDRSVETLAGRLGPHAPLFLPVHGNKSEGLTRDQSQRSRMFLYASLGTVAARTLGLRSLRVYENGVVGLNLPILGQLVGARASRTTHPRTLHLLGKFFTLLVGEPFALENPFLWLTKADVVRLIADAEFADLIGPSISCGNTIGRSNAQTHCGACSQCLDRRFGVLAAGLGAFDPAGQYGIDLVTGERLQPDDRTMLVGYLDRARRVGAMDAVAFLSAYGEVARATPGGLGRAGDVARSVFDLYRRHSAEVLGVVAGVIQAEAGRLAAGEGDPSPLVALSVQPAQVVVEVPAAEPDYLFRRGPDFWAVRFGGSETKYVKGSEGMRAIARLLGSPLQDIQNLVLAGEVADGPTVSVVQAGLPLADAKAIGQYRKALADIQAQLEVAAAAGDTDRVGQLEGQRDQLATHIRSVTNQTGDIRTDSSDVERARKLVSTNLSNALKAVKRHNEPLAAHLKAAIVRRDRACRYAPEEPVPWEC